MFLLLLAVATQSPLTLVYTGDRMGKVEPCGCPQNPMGHIARQVAAIDGYRSKGQNHLFFDLGNLFFESLQSPKELREQHARRAAILSRSVARMELDFLVPGPTDFHAGFEGYKRLVSASKTPVLAADLSTKDGPLVFESHRVFKRAGKRILVIGIAGFTPQGSDFVLQDALDTVRSIRAKAGAVDITIVASHLDRPAALRLASEEPGLAAVLVADNHLHLIPKEAGGAVVVGSSKQGKHLAELKLWQRQSGAYAGGMKMRRLQIKLRKASGAERAVLQQELDGLNAGNTFKYRIEAMGEQRPEDAEVATWVKAYVHFVGRMEATRGVAPPGYDGSGDFAGFEVCAACHVKITEQWKNTRHAHAYQSLLDRGQQLDRECIACHSAGWRHPGGFSDPRSVGILKNVQCESCHGPGKAHAQSGDKALIERGKGEAKFCHRCHQEELETGFTEATHLPLIKHW
jgi:hypothetical protein